MYSWLFKKDDLVSSTLKQVASESESKIENDKNLKHLELWIWIAKALVFRQHKLSDHFVKKVYIL